MGLSKKSYVVERDIDSKRNLMHKNTSEGKRYKAFPHDWGEGGTQRVTKEG